MNSVCCCAASASRRESRSRTSRLRALALDLLPSRDVAHEPGEELPVVGPGLHGRDRQLDRELASVRAHRGQLEPLTEQARLGTLGDPAECAAMCLAQRVGNDQRGHLLAEDLVAAVSEHALGGGVELDDVPVRVDRDDGVEGGLEHRALHGLALARHLLGLPAARCTGRAGCRSRAGAEAARGAACGARACRTRRRRGRGARRGRGTRAPPTARPLRATVARMYPSSWLMSLTQTGSPRSHAWPGSPSPRANAVRRLSPRKPAAWMPGSCHTSTTRSASPRSSIVQSAPSCHPSVRPIASSAFGVTSSRATRRA